MPAKRSTFYENHLFWTFHISVEIAGKAIPFDPFITPKQKAPGCGSRYAYEIVSSGIAAGRVSSRIRMSVPQIISKLATKGARNSGDGRPICSKRASGVMGGPSSAYVVRKPVSPIRVTIPNGSKNKHSFLEFLSASP